MPTVAKDDALAAMVPAEIASDGKLVIGTDASYAPGEFIDTDGKTIVGFDADLAKAVGQVLGLEAEMQNAPFDSLVEGVKTGKYELGVSSFTINPDREKQVDMPSYFSAGTSWAAPKGNPNGITPDNACGRKIAVQKATVQVDDITARSTTCTDAGKDAITIEQYQLQSDATAAVVSGKDDAMLADSPVVGYADHPDRGQARDRGRHLRRCPVRLRRAQGPGRLHEGHPGRAAEADGRRDLPEGPDELGRPERCDHQV